MAARLVRSALPSGYISCLGFILAAVTALLPPPDVRVCVCVCEPSGVHRRASALLS